LANALIIPAYIVWNNFEGELALFDTRDGAYHALNRTAASIWRAIAAGNEVSQIAEILAAAAGAPHDLVAEDVNAFVADARAKGLLVAEADA
jgi:hypothetical protein